MSETALTPISNHEIASAINVICAELMNTKPRYTTYDTTLNEEKRIIEYDDGVCVTRYEIRRKRGRCVGVHII